jgi:NifU-like protein involved in Fe-S cluster formation
MNDIYQEELMEILRHPAHQGSLAKPDASIDQANQFCGDLLHLELEIKNSVITRAVFRGQACMVSQLASEILLEHVEGMTVAEAKTLNKEKLLSLLQLNLSTSRVACATLVLKALHQALENYEKNT